MAVMYGGQGGTWLIGQFVYICPPFFDVPEPAPPNHQLCPDVQNNQFVPSPDAHYPGQTGANF